MLFQVSFYPNYYKSLIYKNIRTDYRFLISKYLNIIYGKSKGKKTEYIH